VARSTNPSCAGLTRASIFFAKNFLRRGWIAGSSPAMTAWMETHAISVTVVAALWSPSARLQMQPAGVRKYNRCFRIVIYNEFCNSHVSSALSPQFPLTAMWSNRTMRQPLAWARLGAQEKRHPPRPR
jgi:hypothetical protein